jgi:hypothetical protein
MRNENRFKSRKQYEKPKYNKEYNSRERPERDENNERRDFNNPKYNYKYEKERSIENNYSGEDNDNNANIPSRSREILNNNNNNHYNNTYGDENPSRYNSRMNDNERKNYINASVDRLENFEDSRNRFNYKVLNNLILIYRKNVF